tara:strand:- start:9788 stop:9997 length:210 start_codon:yes stop_codon:yes gene_type:complete
MGFLRPKVPTPPPPPPAPPVPNQTPTYHQNSMVSKILQKGKANKISTVLTGSSGLMDDPNIVYKKKLGE